MSARKSPFLDNVIKSLFICDVSEDPNNNIQIRQARAFREVFLSPLTSFQQASIGERSSLQQIGSIKNNEKKIAPPGEQRTTLIDRTQDRRTVTRPDSGCRSTLVNNGVQSTSTVAPTKHKHRRAYRAFAPMCQQLQFHQHAQQNHKCRWS